MTRTISSQLAPTSNTPFLDAQVLLANILNKPRTWLLAHPEVRLTEEQQQVYSQGLARLAAGEPLPYLIGHWEFFGLDFRISPQVLIPRPETELLVEKALAWLNRHPDRRLAADVGTGSGCIAISLAVHQPDLQLLATDCSPQALEVARQNAGRHGVSERIRFHQADLLHLQEPASLPAGFDLIAANLPYIPSQTLKGLAVYGREPSLALDGGPDGLDLIRRLLAQARTLLASGGLMLLEIEYRQGELARALGEANFPTAQVAVDRDLAGKDRLLVIEQAE
jgi:release factor glutamine methyltransferase